MTGGNETVLTLETPHQLTKASEVLLKITQQILNLPNRVQFILVTQIS